MIFSWLYGVYINSDKSKLSFGVVWGVWKHTKNRQIRQDWDPRWTSPGSCRPQAALGWWPHTSCDMWGHNPQLWEENGARTESSLPSKSHGTEADTRSYRFSNKALRPFRNLLSIYFTISTHWSAPILRHCCKKSRALRKYYLRFFCKTEHSYVWTILFMYAFIFPHLFGISPQKYGIS